MYLEGDENASAAAAGTSDSVSESTSSAPAAGAQDNQQPKAVDPPAGEQAGNATQATAPAGDVTAAATPAAPPAPAAAAPEQGDPGDENPATDAAPAVAEAEPEPITAAKDSVEVTVSFGEFETFRHVFVPNSTPFIRSLAAVIKAKELADLEALAKTGEITVSVNGAVVDHNLSSLELGVGDGARISISA
jgi:hypothetical protein